MSETRFMLLRVSQRSIMELLINDFTEIITVNKIKLPQDVSVISFFPEFDRQGFAFVLESKEFEPVPEGEQIPALPDDWTEIIQIKSLIKHSRACFNCENRDVYPVNSDAYRETCLHCWNFSKWVKKENFVEDDVGVLPGVKEE